MSSSALPASMLVLPWPDPMIDRLGHDPRSFYVEQYWLGVLGPSACWLIRRLAAAFDDHPDGYVIEPATMAAEIGLGRGIGANAPFTRTVARLCLFSLAQRTRDQLIVRRRIPPLNRRQLAKLPERLGRAHQQMETLALDQRHRDDEEQRARRLALTLVELGESCAATERQLQRWRCSPETSRAASEWASRRGEHRHSAGHYGTDTGDAA